MGGLRIASGVIGALGAGLGALKGCVLFVGVAALGAVGNAGFNPFILLWMVFEGGTVASCVLGMAGAGFAIASKLPLRVG